MCLFKEIQINRTDKITVFTESDCHRTKIGFPFESPSGLKSTCPIILSFREGSAERTPPVGFLQRTLSSQRLEVLEMAAGAARATSWSEGVDRIGRGGGGRKRTSDGGRGALLQGENKVRAPKICQRLRDSALWLLLPKSVSFASSRRQGKPNLCKGVLIKTHWYFET